MPIQTDLRVVTLWHKCRVISQPAIFLHFSFLGDFFDLLCKDIKSKRIKLHRLLHFDSVFYYNTICLAYLASDNAQILMRLIPDAARALPQANRVAPVVTTSSTSNTWLSAGMRSGRDVNDSCVESQRSYMPL